MTKDEIAAELQRRGIDPDKPSTYQKPSAANLSPEQISTELRNRGIDPDNTSVGPSGGSSAADIAGKVGRTALNAVAAPFQVAGEAIRQAGTQDPLQIATAKDPRGLRAPSIIQQMAPSLQTPQPPADPFMQAAMGLKGIATTAANLPQGIQPALQAGKEAVQGPPGIAEHLGALAMGLGTGEAGNLPFTAAVNAVKGGANVVPKMAQLSNLVKDVNPEIVEQAQKFKVPITAAGQTGGGTQGAVENLLSRMPFSKDIISKYADQTLAALDQNVRQPLIAGAKDETELGPQIQESIRQATNTAKANAQSLYSNASNALPEGQTIPLTNVQSKAKELLTSQNKLGDLGAQSSGVMQILKKVAGGDATEDAISQMVPKGASAEQIQKARQILQSSGYKAEAPPAADYQTLQGLRSELNARIAAADQGIKSGSGMSLQSSPEAGVYKQLKTALDKDIGDFSEQQGGAFKQALDQANSTYGQYKQAFSNNKFIKSIMTEQDPVKVVDRAMNIDNPTAVAALRTNLPAPVLDSLQSKFIQSMTEKNPGQFSPTHFVTQYNKHGEEALTNFLGTVKMEALKPLYILSKAATQAERVGANPSGTGQAMAGVIGMTAPLMQLFRGHPGTALSIAGGEATALPLAAKAYLSNPVTNLLTNRTNIIQNAAGAAQQAAPVGKVQQNISDLISQLQQKYAKRRQF